MEEDEILVQVGAMCVLVGAWYAIQQRRRRPKRFGVRKMFRERNTHGAYKTLVPQLRQDPEWHTAYFRMSLERLEHLLSIIGPHMQRCSTNTPLSPDERLCITLRYLASGITMTAISTEYRASKQTISTAIREVCQLLWKHLQPEFLPGLDSQSLKNMSEDMFKKWNMPNCVGALGGKFVQIRCGVSLQNCKKSTRMVLFVTSDAHKCFTAVDIEFQELSNDAVVFTDCTLGKKLCEGSLNVFESSRIPGTTYESDYYFVADRTFPLMNTVMCPFEGEELSADELHYNDQISKVCTLVDNAFGILTACWQVYNDPICGNLEKVEAVIRATFILHNYIMMDDRTLPQVAHQYFPENFTGKGDQEAFQEMEWHKLLNDRKGLQPFVRVTNDLDEFTGDATRSMLMKYFATMKSELPPQTE